MERKCKEVLHKDNYRAFFVEKYDNEVLFKMRRDTNRINFYVTIKELETKYEIMLEVESICL